MKKTLKNCKIHGYGANGLGCYCKKRRQIQIVYDGKPDDEIDTRIAAVLEHDLNFNWYAQGYDAKTDKRDIVFEEICDKFDDDYNCLKCKKNVYVCKCGNC